MPTILHILTRPSDELAADVIRRQRDQATCAIEVFDLTREPPDYPALLERVFSADAVLTW